jgi:hypothetical protein
MLKMSQRKTITTKEKIKAMNEAEKIVSIGNENIVALGELVGSYP